MSVPFIASPNIASPNIAAPIAPQPSRPDAPPLGIAGRGFDAALAAESSEQAVTASNAEELVGTRIRAPEGGCGCDALVAAAEPTTTEPAGIAPASAATVPGLALLTSAQLTSAPLASIGPGGVEAGDVLLLTNRDDLSGRLHQAIVRNATEMIAANRAGMIEVLSIPWDRVAGVR